MSYYAARRPHYLAKNCTSSTPSSLLFFDTETKSEPVKEGRRGAKLSLWFGYALYFRIENGKRTRERGIYFDSTESFWSFFISCLSPHRPLWVFAHNLPFDFTIVDGWLRIEREKIRLEERVLEGPPTIIGWREGKCRVTFVDTLNFWRTSLADIGDSFGLKKLPMPEPHDAYRKWKTYCKRDVDVIAKAVEDYLIMIREDDLGTFRSTFPSQAMHAFRHRFMRDCILIHNVTPALKLERNGYYGGLVRNFFLGVCQGKPTFHYDVNSLYPYVMLNPMPTRLVRYGGSETLSDLREHMKIYGVMARVTLHTKSDTYPLRHNHKLIEATGKFDTTLAGPELKEALERGHIRKVHEVGYYDMACIFTDYVTYFYAERLKYKKLGNRSKEMFCKNMLNSLYGKFGQRSPEWRAFSKSAILEIFDDYGIICEDADALASFIPDITWGKDEWFVSTLPHPIPYRVLGGNMEVGIRAKEAAQSSPAIAAYVTSYARCYLRKLIALCGQGNVFYCDTDSLFVNQKGRDALEGEGLIHPTEIGKLKFEREYSLISFYGPKDYDYVLGGKTKGIRKSAIELGPGEYLQAQFEGIKSILNRHPDPYIRIFPIRKELRGGYDKGVVSKSGWVKPLHFPLV
jgi:hypothetical protein